MTWKWNIFVFLWYSKQTSSVSKAIVNIKYSKNCILIISFQDMTWHLKHKALDVYWLKVTSWLKELQEQKYKVISVLNRDQLCASFLLERLKWDYSRLRGHEGRPFLWIVWSSIQQQQQQWQWQRQHLRNCYNANSPLPPRTYKIWICILIKFPTGLYAYLSLRNSDPSLKDSNRTKILL